MWVYTERSPAPAVALGPGSVSVVAACLTSRPASGPRLPLLEETVVLGGTLGPDDWDTTPREADRRRIYERACAVLPSLRSAEIVAEWVSAAHVGCMLASLWNGGELSVSLSSAEARSLRPGSR